MTNSVRTLFLFILTLLTACSRTNYSEKLSERNLQEYNFSSEANTQLSLDIPGELDGTTVKAVLPKGTDLSQLTATFSLTGYALFINNLRQQSGESVGDFTSTVSCNLFSYDGQSTEYTITAVESEAYFETFAFTTGSNSALETTIDATVSGNGIWFYLPHTYSLRKLVPDFTYQQLKVTLNDGEQESGSSMADFSSPLVYRVFAYDGKYMDYQVSCYRLTALSFAAADDSFSGDYSAYLEDSTITVQVPTDADLSALVPTFSYLGDYITFDGQTLESGVGSYDFSAPVSLVVGTDSGLSHEYTLNVINAESPQNQTNDPVYADGSGTENGQYALTYDANGGSNAPAESNTYNQGDSVTISSTAPVRSGYQFTGWNTAADGSGTSYAAGATFSMGNTNMTLYAQWVDTTAPGQVTLSDTLSKSGSSIAVNWSDPSGDPTLSHIDVTCGGTTKSITEGTESCTFSSLLNLTSYTITLVSVDDSGNESDPVIFTLSTGASTDTTLIEYTTISTRSELEAISLSGNYILIADIDLSDREWDPIGSVTLNNRFTGTFDGGGHVIKNLTVTSSSDTTPDSDAGLFGYIGGATLQYLALVDVDISISGCWRTGSLTGGAYNSSILYCYATGTVEGGVSTGGLVGNITSSSITHCYTHCNVIASGEGAGGFVGTNGNTSQATNISMCYATGTVEGTGTVGGFAGYNTAGTISQCYATGDVVNTGSFCGGFVGAIKGSGSTINCYAFGSVSGGSYIGAFGGDHYDGGTVSYCYATGSASNGFFAQDRSSTDGTNFTGCYYNNEATSYDIGTATDIDSITGLTTTEMQNSPNFTDWDFVDDSNGSDDIWSIDTNSTNPINNGYPYLTGFSVPVTSVSASATTTVKQITIGWQDSLAVDVYVDGTIEQSGATSNYTLSSISGGTEYTIDLVPEDDTIPTQHIVLTPQSGDNITYTLIHTPEHLEAVNDDSTSLADDYLLMADLDLSSICAAASDSSWTPIGNASSTCFEGIFEGSNHKVFGLNINREGLDERGLFGWVSNAHISNLGIVGADIVAQNKSGLLAGIVENSSVVINCYSTGSFTCRYQIGGGLIGSLLNSQLKQSYSEAEVSDKDIDDAKMIGGLVGNSSGTILNCYAKGTATINKSATLYVGGLVAYNTGTIYNSYATGAVSTTGSNYGGLVGYGSTTKVEDSFYDTDTTGLSTSAGGTAASTTAMQTQSTYTDAGWDFDDIWSICEYVNGGYPYLQGVGR